MLGTTKPPYTLALHRFAPAGRWLRGSSRRRNRRTARRDAGGGTARSRVLHTDTDPLSHHHADARRRRGKLTLKPRYGAPMFCFGPHASTTPLESMSRAPAVDGMFVGEPEDAVAAARPPRFARSARRNTEPDLAAGGFNRTASCPRQLHGLPERCRIRRGTSAALDPTRCRWSTSLYVIVETSRGCPYTCDFCVAPIHQGHKFRERSAKALVDEIERSYRELGVEFFYLWGDTVTLNVKSFTAFCDELIARNLPIHWFGNARADNLTDPAFVHRLRRAGCWMLALGIESESEEIRKDMVKRLEREKIQTAFRNMRDGRHQVLRILHLRLPGRNARDDGPDDRYAIELDPDFANFYPAVPYPGTALYDKCVRDGLLHRRMPTGRGWSTGTTCCAATVSTSASSWNRSTARSDASSCGRPTCSVTRGCRKAGADEAGHRLAGALQDRVRRASRRHAAGTRCAPPGDDYLKSSGRIR